MNTTYKFLLPIAVLATSLFSSCELYNPAEPIPAYIHIQKFTLITDNSTQGSNSHKITDAWVYVDDQIIGCFELPATIPIIAEGNHKIKISPGIKVSGISADRAQYPFYTSHEQNVDFQKGTIITLTPTVTYNAIADFAFMQDFETAGTTLNTTTNSDTIIEYVTFPSAFEGTSLAGYTDPTRFRFECIMTDSVDLPKGGSPVFLEFNYKCNHYFTVSVWAIGSGGQTQFSAINLNPSTNWNKIYVYLTPIVSGAYTATGYKVEWGFHNIEGADSAAIFLDNIKLIK